MSHKQKKLKRNYLIGDAETTNKLVEEAMENQELFAPKPLGPGWTFESICRVLGITLSIVGVIFSLLALAIVYAD